MWFYIYTMNLVVALLWVSTDTMIWYGQAVYNRRLDGLTPVQIRKRVWVVSVALATIISVPSLIGFYFATSTYSVSAWLLATGSVVFSWSLAVVLFMIGAMMLFLIIMPISIVVSRLCAVMRAKPTPSS